ncbi:hypothetical protein E4U41_003590, partial [Claviceps citrina]
MPAEHEPEHPSPPGPSPRVPSPPARSNPDVTPSWSIGHTPAIPAKEDDGSHPADAERAKTISKLVPR